MNDHIFLMLLEHATIMSKKVEVVYIINSDHLLLQVQK